MRIPVLITLGAGCLAMPLAAQPAGPAPAAGAQAKRPHVPFVQAEAAEAVRALATTLEEDFVFPEVGKAYAQMLRGKLAAGAYSSFPDAFAFSEQVTADLQAVHKDGHLKLRPVPPASAQGGKGGPGGPPPGSAITKSGWLAKGVAYVDFKGFPGNDATIADLKRFLAEHKDAKTLIIDARNHHGGGLTEMDLMFPMLFAKPTVLVASDTRLSVMEKGEDPGAEDMRLRKIAGPPGVVRQEHYVEPAAQPTGLRDAKVYLLVSNKTVSAGEHLSLSLKRTGRATLIGETTRGAGHYGGVQKMGSAYAAFIPVGRTFDPDNNEGWEGTGVKPHIEVPADKALDEALKLAGVTVSGQAALAGLK